MVHARFTDLPDFLRPGDLVVANDSGTLPAALTARRPDGSAIALHLSTNLTGDLWVVEPRKIQATPTEVLRLADVAERSGVPVALDDSTGIVTDSRPLASGVSGMAVAVPPGRSETAAEPEPKKTVTNIRVM